MSVTSAMRPLTVSEPLQPQDLVITLLGTYIRPRGGTAWSGGLVQLLGEFGFSQGAARAALTRLVRRGLLSRVRQGRLIHYRVTERADRLLAEGDRRSCSGSWRSRSMRPYWWRAMRPQKDFRGLSATPGISADSLTATAHSWPNSR